MRSAPRRLEIANRQRRARPRRADIQALIDRILDREGDPRGVSVALVGERTMRCLHREWVGEDSVTDVLSFPSGDPTPGPEREELTAGEVVICIPVCEEAARDHRVPIHEEVARMLIHGVLHLLGYDHGTPRQLMRMRPLESSYRSWYRRERLEVVEPR